MNNILLHAHVFGFLLYNSFMRMYTLTFSQGTCTYFNPQLSFFPSIYYLTELFLRLIRQSINISKYAFQKLSEQHSFFNMIVSYNPYYLFFLLLYMLVSHNPKQMYKLLARWTSGAVPEGIGFWSIQLGTMASGALICNCCIIYCLKNLIFLPNEYIYSLNQNVTVD